MCKSVIRPNANRAGPCRSGAAVRRGWPGRVGADEYNRSSDRHGRAMPPIDARELLAYAILIMPRDRLRIALISPKGPLYRHRGGIFKKSLRYQPLTLTTLAALVPKELNAELTLIDEGIEDVPDRLDVDLVGLTAITGTAPRAYELSARFRAQGDHDGHRRART